MMDATHCDRKSVLVVDDDKDFASSLAIILNHLGHHIEMAHDGLTALSKVEALFPDVGVLDITLPSLNGFSVARRLRSYDWGAQMTLVAVTCQAHRCHGVA